LRARILALCAPLFLVACSGTASDDQLSRLLYKDAAPDSIEVPATEAISLDQLSSDAQMALRAVVLRLHGNDAAAVDTAVGLTGSAAAQPEPDFTYNDFTVRRIKLVEQGADFLHVLLRFEDQAGRTAAAAIAARYRRDAAGLNLTEVAYRPLFPAHPRVELLIVPADKLEPGFVEAAAGYAALRSFVEERAVAMRNPAEVDGAAQDYVAFAFPRDRIAGDASIAMRLSDQRLGVQGYEEQTRYLAFEPGWGAALTPGTFALAADRAFWIKVIYDPNGSVPGAGDGERVVGLFSTAPSTAAAK
jgi:hypothetical protein